MPVGRDGPSQRSHNREVEGDSKNVGFIRDACSPGDCRTHDENGEAGQHIAVNFPESLRAEVSFLRKTSLEVMASRKSTETGNVLTVEPQATSQSAMATCVPATCTPEVGLPLASEVEEEEISGRRRDRDLSAFHVPDRDVKPTGVDFSVKMEQAGEEKLETSAERSVDKSEGDVERRTVPGSQADGGGGDEEEFEKMSNTCVECEDQHAEMVCLSCGELFCRPCWGSLHRRGKRAAHVTQVLLGELMPAPTTTPEPPAAMSTMPGTTTEKSMESDTTPTLDGEGASTSTSKGQKSSWSRRQLNNPAANFVDRGIEEECKFIPLRLDARERRLLAMLQGALNVSEYTDHVDVVSRWGKSKTIRAELIKALRLLACMMVAGDAKGGDKLLAGKDLQDLEDFFQEIFEVGRRYKITNPDKFRSQYGKMMYMLQDSQSAKHLQICLVKDIKMVHSFVDERGGLALLGDKRIHQATAEVSDKNMGKKEVSEHVSRKQAARAELIGEYASKTFSRADIERALDSIGDANNYLAFNVSPVERMLALLRDHFHPDKPEKEWSLRLTGGRKRMPSSSMLYGSASTYSLGPYASYGSYGGGFGSSLLSASSAKLSHDHSTQFTFVTQSLRLWSEAMRSMYRLWYYADSDLLSGRASYRLCNTGQGLNRVQNCPSVSMEMKCILNKVQAECGPWVGLSVVHLGDRDVPNALMFIDKYTQIPRILTPVADTISSLEELSHNPILGQYMENEWGSVHKLNMRILSDFFKHAYDGDGDDGGSCIDGRLTSAWNWCSKIDKKEYYPIFNLAGFAGFDGDWKD